MSSSVLRVNWQRGFYGNSIPPSLSPLPPYPPPSDFFSPTFPAPTSRMPGSIICMHSIPKQTLPQQQLNYFIINHITIAQLLNIINIIGTITFRIPALGFRIQDYQAKNLFFCFKIFFSKIS